MLRPERDADARNDGEADRSARPAIAKKAAAARWHKG